MSDERKWLPIPVEVGPYGLPCLIMPAVADEDTECIVFLPKVRIVGKGEGRNINGDLVRGNDGHSLLMYLA